MPQPVDQLIHAEWIVPIVPSGAVWPGHSLAVRQGRIVDILPTPQARERYAAAREFDLPRQALMPGLVNLHAHAAMSLMRGLADDLPLMTWLQDHIWPAEAKHLGPGLVFDGTLLACAEMLLGGVTCMNDMYFFPEDAARACLQAGMRAALGNVVIEFPTAYAADAQECLRKAVAVQDTFQGEPLLSFTLAPHAPYTVSDRSLSSVVALSERLGCRVHMHLHETEEEVRQGLEQHGVRPLARLQALGLPGPNLIAVHAVHLTDEEIEGLASAGCHIAHCPASNLKLASGLPPLDRWLRAGVNVGIGTDGAASNNRLDVLDEMRLAALLAKGVSGRADAVPAHTALALATLNAARALGLDDRIGSLEAGKCADLVAIDLAHPGTAPCFDVASHLVYAAGREQVSHVWVDGVLRVEGGRLTGLDTGMLLDTATRWRHTLRPSP
jgi:5-methylthioadenosine/S-adenosylhomocysteine deaminase